MRDIILTVLTSEGCGHCHNLRGNGELGNGTQFTQHGYLKNHLDPLQNGKGCSILNINFGSMAGRTDDITDISKIYLKNKLIVQEKYYNQGNEVMVKIITIDEGNERKIIGDKKANVDYKWPSFVTRKIPKDIERYTFFFPCFVVFELKDWKRAKNILGLTNAGFTIRNEKGEYMLEKNGATLSERNVPPQKLVTEAMSGLTKFEPHKDLFKKQDPPKKKVEDPPKKVENAPKKVEDLPKKVEDTRRTFLIKSYDDDDDD